MDTTPSSLSDLTRKGLQTTIIKPTEVLCLRFELCNVIKVINRHRSGNKQLQGSQGISTFVMLLSGIWALHLLWPEMNPLYALVVCPCFIHITDFTFSGLWFKCTEENFLKCACVNTTTVVTHVVVLSSLNLISLSFPPSLEVTRWLYQSPQCLLYPITTHDDPSPATNCADYSNGRVCVT